MSIQTWKLKRELDRIRSQIAGWFSETIEPALRRRHDNWLAKVEPSRGGQSAGNRIAIFLLYQPAGIASSTIASCQFLVDSGFSIVVVSNAAVSEHDRKRLHPWIWCLIERPNFGYDFGGYRDGIHWLWSQRLEIECLLLVNDSIWFPVLADQSSSWIQELTKQDAAFCGIMELAGHRHERSGRKAKPPFLGSFFLLFKNAAIKHQAFESFWREYKMSSNKGKTIRRGERHISAVMISAGFQPHALFRREHFDMVVANASPVELRDLLLDLCSFDDKLKIDQARLVEQFDGSINWSREALIVVNALTDIQNLLVTAPIACLTRFRLPIIKKAVTYQNQIALRAIETAFTQNRIKLVPTVADELRAILNRLDLPVNSTN